MLFLLSMFACKNNILLSSGELGNINYTIVTGYKIDGLSLNEAKLAVGYPQTIEASLTLRGWKVVGDQPFLVYHSSADEKMSVESESLLDGDIGVPGFEVQADSAGSFMVESYLQDKLVDQIALTFVVPDAISVLSWIREPGAENSLQPKEKPSMLQLVLKQHSSRFQSLKVNALSETLKPTSALNHLKPLY